MHRFWHRTVRRTGRVRALGNLFCLLLPLSVLSALADDSVKTAPVASDDPVSRFKRLLQSPPPIQQMHFREKLPPRLNRPVPVETGITGSTNFASFQLTWQTNAIAVERIDLTDLLPRVTLKKVGFTMYGDDFWFLDAGTNIFQYHLEHARVRAGTVPPAYDAAWYRITRYGEVLNLGLSHIWPGTVRWNEGSFTAVGLADKKPIYVSGAISAKTREGVPCEMSVLYSNDVGVAHYRLTYEYERYAYPFYPTRISLLWRAPAREIEYRTYDILSVEPAERPLPRQRFLPAAMLKEPGPETAYFTNDSIYVRLESGNWLETAGASPQLRLSRSDYYKNRYFYGALAAISALFAAAISRRSIRPTRKEIPQ